MPFGGRVVGSSLASKFVSAYERGKWCQAARSRQELCNTDSLKGEGVNRRQVIVEFPDGIGATLMPHCAQELRHLLIAHPERHEPFDSRPEIGNAIGGRAVGQPLMAVL